MNERQGLPEWSGVTRMASVWWAPEKQHHTCLQDYSDMPLNIMSYVCKVFFMV